MANLAIQISDEDFQKVCDEFTTAHPDPVIQDMFAKVKSSVSKTRKAQELLRMIGIPMEGQMCQ